MNAPQKTILLGLFLPLLATVIFPPFQQTHKGTKLMYSGDLGRHLVWRPPKPTGEKSWLLNAPASECEVSIESGVVLRQIGILAAITAVLLFAFRRWPQTPVKTRGLVFTSLAVALCLPVPVPDGVPLVFYVLSAPISPFVDNGHLGPWFIPMIAGVALAGYFAVIFLIMIGTVRFVRHRANKT